MEVIAKSVFALTRQVTGSSLMFGLNVQGSQIQVYDPTVSGSNEAAKYIPNFAVKNTVVTPVFSGGKQNFNKGTWSATDATGASVPISAIGTESSAYPYALTINKNITKAQMAWTLKYSCSYTDPITKKVSPLVATQPIALVLNPNSTAIGWIETPDGSKFHNELQTATRRLVMRMTSKGGGEDTTGNTYKWYYADNKSSDGWSLITSANAKGITGYDTQTLVVPASFVPQMQAFKCVCTDADKTSGTDREGNALTAVACATLMDDSDPYKLVHTETMTLGDGSQVLSVYIQQGGMASPGKLDATGILTNDFILKQMSMRILRHKGDATSPIDSGVGGWGDVDSGTHQPTGAKVMALSGTSFTTTLSPSDCKAGLETTFFDLELSM